MTERANPMIVAGYANPGASGRALAVAAELARDLQAHLTVVHVVDLDDYPVDPDAADFEVEAARRLQAERAEVTEQLAGSGVTWTYTVARGNPVDALTRIAEQVQARFIVIGTRTASNYWARLEHLLHATPSVVHGLEHAKVPVVVVPTEPVRRR
jgi:nucleotide-binding universal stress UspA family protein